MIADPRNFTNSYCTLALADVMYTVYSVICRRINAVRCGTCRSGRSRLP
jgi:hypothetical protein